MFRVTTEPLSVQQVNDLVKRPTDGAVVTFDGIVRNNFDGRSVRYLEYEAYAAMAEKKLAEIGAEVQQKFAIGEIAMVHRIGRLEIGESSIVIAVAAPHRHAAFEACCLRHGSCQSRSPGVEKRVLCRWCRPLGESKLTMADLPDYRTALLAPHPFWATLSPTTVKQRIEQLLAAPDSAALVQALSPVEYTVLLKAAPDMRALLLQLGHPEQIRTVLDLDCWHKDTLQMPRVLEWLEALQQSGEVICAQTLQTLDSEMLSVVLHRHIRVNAALPSEEEEDPGPYDEVLSNELYRVAFIDPDSPLNERVVEFLRVLRLTDLDMYHRLMQEAMWAQESDLEEWAYRWRTGRLQDEGIPDYYEALEAYHVIDDRTAPWPPSRPLGASRAPCQC